MDSSLSDLLEKLESKIAYLEYNYENLNEEVIELRAIVEKQKIQIKFLANKLKGLDASNVAPRSEETPPPHY
ncbi:MAG: SlyX family protein [Succinivibrionaceae bacterium]